jgi:peptidoglycan/LPS O-acetylase OafA/YrhL
MGQSEKPLYIPSLDGIRAFAIAVVFFAHAGLSKIVPGLFGVTIFFFLSGYLITTLLRLEHQRTGHISLKQFYLRRVIRIFPPLYLILGLALLAPVVGLIETKTSPTAVVSQVLFMANYYGIFSGHGLPSGTGVLWSLAVEEHFYLFFPLFYLVLLRKVPKPRDQMLVMVGLSALVLAWRCIIVFGLHLPTDKYDGDLSVSQHWTMHGTDTRLDSLLFGCILAVYGNPVLDETRYDGRWWKWFWVPLSVVVLVATFVIRDEAFRQTVRYTAQGLAMFPLFIVAIRYPDWGVMKFLNHRAVKFVGVLSYAFYLVHNTIIEVVVYQLPHRPLLLGCLSLVISLVISALVYYLVEKPFARLRKRISAFKAARAPAKPTPPIFELSSEAVAESRRL